MGKEKFRNGCLAGKAVRYLVMCMLFFFCLLGGKNQIVQAESVTPAYSEWSYTLDAARKQMTITLYNGTGTEITVPAAYSIGGTSYKVVVNGAVFKNNTTIKRVTFAAGVSAANCDSMFYGCTSLEGVSGIPEGANDCRKMFYNCSSLIAAPVIPSGVTNCWAMFYGCSSITSAPAIPAGVTNCNMMFQNCSSLTSAPVIPEGVQTCELMFYGCSSLSSAPELPAGVEHCGWMFANCSKLKTAPETIPEGVVSCSMMFFRCYSLETAPKAIPAGVTDCSEMFYDCNSLKSVPVISEDVTNCDHMFYGCSSITVAPVVPAGVDNCEGMFYNCKSLSGVLQVLGNPTDYTNMLYNAGINGSGLTIYCVNDEARSKLMDENAASNAKIQVKPMAEKKDVITFDGNGGTSSTASKKVYVYGTYGNLPTASRSGYSFNGWFTAKTGGSKVEAGTKVTNTNDHTLYAQWTKKISAPASSTGTTSQSTAGATSQPANAYSFGGNQNSGASSGTGRTVPHYDIRIDGGTWTGSLYYKADGTLATECFFCDGTYTYYLMNDGTPMKNRLTYHPNGVNLIYFDEYGHELFDQFQFCQDVQYTCYFNTYGYMYFSVSTFWNGNAYYMDATGRMMNNGWFIFDDNNIDIGYANADGTLMASQFSYDQWGRTVYFGADGRIARGLISDGVYYYQMDETDGHLIGMFPVN